MEHDLYKAWVILPDGTVTGTEGRIGEVAKWTEQMIAAIGGDITVKIQRTNR